MSNFEYLGQISLGQYLPTGSIIHRLNPGVKLAGYTLLILAVTLSRQPVGLCAAFVLILALLAVSRTPLRFALRGLRRPLPFILILAVLQLFMVSYRSGTAWLAWGIFRITAEGLTSAATLCVRFVALVLLLTACSTTLSTLELVHGLDILLSPLSWLGIQTAPASMVIQIMLRFLPSLALSAEKIAKSQASRGAAWGNPHANIVERARQLLPLLIPLFNVNLQQADALANAMIARCYGRSNKRTALVRYRTGWADVLFFFLVLGAVGLTLFFTGSGFSFQLSIF